MQNLFILLISLHYILIYHKKTCFKTSLNCAIFNRDFYFTVNNVFLLQTVGIPMGNDLVSVWGDLYLCNYESKYIANLIKTKKFRSRRFQSIFRFIDDLCALNNASKFSQTFLEINSTELELKVKHNGSHAIFLDLDISTDKGKLIYRIIDKWAIYNFHIVKMSSIASIIPSNIFSVRLYQNLQKS